MIRATPLLIALSLWACVARRTRRSRGSRRFRVMPRSQRTRTKPTAGRRRPTPTRRPRRPLRPPPLPPTPDAGPGTAPPAPRPDKTVVFTVPNAQGTPDLTIERALLTLIAHAAPGSTIRIAMYTFTRTSISNALLAAHRRGVDVRLVLDRVAVGEDPHRDLAAALPAGAVTVCHPDDAEGSCIGTNINHNKLALFSALQDGTRDIVAQSSANFTTAQTKMHNNLVVIRGDHALFTAYSDYWNDLQRQMRDPDYYHSEAGSTGARAYFFPRSDGDTILGVLTSTDCTAGAHLRLAIPYWTSARLEIATRLGEMFRAGCEVEVVAGNDDGNPAPEVAAAFSAAGVPVTLYAVGPAGQGVHSKYLLIEGRYFERDDQHLVWTGSHNFSGPSLTSNDEVLLKVDDRALYDAFVADWTRIREMAAASTR